MGEESSASPQPPARAGQALPQEGGAKSLYYILFPLLSWEKGVRGMRPRDLGEGELAERPKLA